MNGQIESLRQTNAIYVSTQSKMQISLGKLQNNLKNSGELCFELNERVDLLEKEISSREMTINRLSYKVNYYEKEKNRKRDHQRKLITEDVTEPEINGKDKEREMLIKTIETLEKEIISYKSIVNDKINNKPKLNISHCIEPPNQQIILNLREELSDITNKYEKLRKESNYKILSLKNNPYESAISQDKKKCKQLVEDNLKFKQRIVFLENAVKAVKVKTTENCTNAANFSILNNLTFQVNSEIKNPSAEPLVGELREKLNSAQLTQKRLNEVFEDSIKKFQQIYFNLTGFLIKNISRNVYSISTNFNSSNDNVIMIQDSGENIKILRNKFYDEIPDEIKQSLVDSGNIQCFFATYLLHLYN
ncbi:hypothetical protein A3Q56_06269 [Intoshia linei]|uniref:Spindle assembly checkpoint component MAD1 n=1 Tax=Intoshia linei TaxID=1819745 RepID=A0A177AVH1_9BILA|nr:hypothetical protein A3Q56_06269 [Intoshia linei]